MNTSPLNQLAITGSTGLVGSALIALCDQRGIRVKRLVRRASRGSDEVQWDPKTGEVELSKLEQLDAFIHLAGENIAAQRWNAEVKERLRTSRVDATAALIRSIQKLTAPPKFLLCASATGFYGDRDDELLTEPARRDGDS